MNENNEPCMELNEIIYHISGEFWKKAYYELLRKQGTYEPGEEISAKQAIPELRRAIRDLAKENQLTCNSFSHNEHFYMSLIPFPIYIGIEKVTGDFSVSAPHISTKHFSHSEYKRGLKWIQDYINVDITPLTEKTSSVQEKFYVNTKTAEIVKTSIKALCETVLGNVCKKYSLEQSRLKSQITLQASEKECYEIEVYHKPFTMESELLIDLLNNPREMQVEDKVSCVRVSKSLEAV